MDEKETENIYAIPANYTDSGKILGGMLSLRNVFEAFILVLVFGFIELKLIPMQDTVRIVIMVVTLLPIALVALMGIDGESLFQYIGHVFKFLKHRRRLHFKKIGGNREVKR
ncbi:MULTISPECIES: PrgI family mobile element protein [Bacteroidales]|uniref:PrgI family mobile element protein n=1 Tax=Bacteroidales TaxID=171549 RepID=UPI002557FE71|nr:MULTISPECIES: PrgI family protein [Bacteroidales]